MKTLKTAQPNLSIRKGFDVLETLAFSAVPMTTGEVAGKLGLDKSVASRMLLTLGEMGYVERVGRGVWRSSTGLMALSLMGLRNSPLARVKPLLRELQEKTGCDVALGFVWKSQVVYVYHSSDPEKQSTEGLGHVYPAERSSIGRLLTSGRVVSHKLLWLAKGERFSLAVPVEISGVRYGLALTERAEKFGGELVRVAQGIAREMEGQSGVHLP